MHECCNSVGSDRFLLVSKNHAAVTVVSALFCSPFLRVYARFYGWKYHPLHTCVISAVLLANVLSNMLFSVSVSYNQERGVSFENQLPPSTVKGQEETPLLDEDEGSDQEVTSYSKSQLKVTISGYYTCTYMYVHEAAVRTTYHIV